MIFGIENITICFLTKKGTKSMFLLQFFYEKNDLKNQKSLGLIWTYRHSNIDYRVAFYQVPNCKWNNY